MGGGRVLPQGSTLIFSYIRRLGSFFLVKNFEFQYFFGFSEKMIFWGMKILWIFFFFLGGGASQNWTIFRDHFFAF